MEYDVIIVGTGIGGATVAREMTRKGKRVLMLERGGRTDMLGNTLTIALVLQNFGLNRSREKSFVTFADNYGGLSTLAAGCAVPPPQAIFAPHGIDLTAETEEARTDMKVQTLPDDLVGPANLRLLAAANDAGYHWNRVENFIDPGKCVVGCSRCMLGCPTGAKFTARQYGDEAVAGGAVLHLHTKVTKVLIEGGRAIGVAAKRFGRNILYYGKTVVLSAGVANVHLLRQAGIAEAGRGFACDWLQFVGGIVPGINTVRANPMAVGTLEHYEADGIAILPVFPNWSQFMMFLAFMGPGSLAKFTNFRRYSGIMVKIRDEISGKIYTGNAFSKPITVADRKRLDKGVGIIKKVLKKAGAKESDIISLNPLGAHPSASCRIGEVVDHNLATRIAGLYCCDASVFPQALGLPVVWTIAALGKRLARHLGNPGAAAMSASEIPVVS
jgi:choline dehydrogenase-like flavoprotein